MSHNPMFKNISATFHSWLSTRRSRQKRSHVIRQDAAQRRVLKLREILGNTAEETFAKRMAYMRKVDPLVFEEWVLDAFKRNGYKIERGERYSGDGGLDGKVYKDGRWHGIQCKRYKGPIQKAQVDLFMRDLQKFELERGFFVHTGRTPKTVQRHASTVTILSGAELLDFLM